MFGLFAIEDIGGAKVALQSTVPRTATARTNIPALGLASIQIGGDLKKSDDAASSAVRSSKTCEPTLFFSTLDHQGTQREEITFGSYRVQLANTNIVRGKANQPLKSGNKLTAEGESRRRGSLSSSSSSSSSPMYA